MNEGNLKTFDQYDPEELREISARGGRRSGEERQRRKKLREELTVLLSSGDLQERVCLALIDRCISGDPRAFIALRDSLGERLPEGLDVNLSAQSQDLEAWKQTHWEEIAMLWNDEMGRITRGEEERYTGLLRSLLTYQEQHLLLEQSLLDPDPLPVEP